MSTSSRPVARLAGHIAPLLALCMIAMAMLGANPLAGETVAPFDILTRMPGWKNTGIVSPVKHHKHSDVLDFKLPAWRIAREKLRQGELPVWNPHVLGGEPLLLLVTRSILTPAFAAYAAIDDEGVGLYLAALVNLLIISAGSYLLFFSLTQNRLAALIGAVVFSYSGFNLSWFHWHHVNTSIWIPWVLYFALGLLKRGDVRQIPGLAFSSLMMVLGGFPTVAVYGYIALLLMLICWALFSNNRPRLVIQRISLVSLGMLLSFMVALLFLYCLDESLGRLDLSYRRGGSAFRTIEDLLLFVLPYSDGPLTLGRTGYVGLLPLILFIPALWLTWKSRIDWRYAWGLALVILISPLAFAWIPMDYIRAIPLIGTSMISRLILIIGLGFAVLATLVLSTGHRRLSKTLPIWANLLLLLLLLVQVIDQRHVFQTLVGHVKAETIYPMTPAIDYLGDHIDPLQNVISDRGFLLGGVLSAYGLPQWFAHGFHTGEEKRLLKEVVEGPFLTSTAAGFLCDQVRFDDVQGLAYLGVRYVLCSKGPRSGDGAQSHSVFDTVALQSGGMTGLDLTRHKVVQLAALGESLIFDRIDLPLQAVAGVDLPLIKIKFSSGGNTLVLSAPCVVQRDAKEKSLACHFPEQVRLEKGEYQMEVEVERITAGASVVAAVYRSAAPQLRLRVDDKTLDSMLGLRGYRRITPDPYQRVLGGEMEDYSVIEPEPGINLIENAVVRGSAYYIPTFDGQPQADYELVRLSGYDDTSIGLHYVGDRPGWVVLPVRSYPGWSFMVNDREMEPALFKGVLPAVEVNGGETISYRYRPVQYMIPALVSIFGVLLCMGLFFKAHRINQWLTDQV